MDQDGLQADVRGLTQQVQDLENRLRCAERVNEVQAEALARVAGWPRCYSDEAKGMRRVAQDAQRAVKQLARPEAGQTSL